jgi:Mitochondrial carrier protein
MKPPTSKIEYETTMGRQVLISGLSAVMADFLTFPLDTAKVRLQVSRMKTITPATQILTKLKQSRDCEPKKLRIYVYNSN